MVISGAVVIELWTVQWPAAARRPSRRSGGSSSGSGSGGRPATRGQAWRHRVRRLDPEPGGVELVATQVPAGIEGNARREPGHEQLRRGRAGVVASHVGRLVDGHHVVADPDVEAVPGAVVDPQRAGVRRSRSPRDDMAGAADRLTPAGRPALVGGASAGAQRLPAARAAATARWWEPPDWRARGSPSAACPFRPAPSGRPRPARARRSAVPNSSLSCSATRRGRVQPSTGRPSSVAASRAASARCRHGPDAPSRPRSRRPPVPRPPTSWPLSRTSRTSTPCRTRPSAPSGWSLSSAEDRPSAAAASCSSMARKARRSPLIPWTVDASPLVRHKTDTVQPDRTNASSTAPKAKDSSSGWATTASADAQAGNTDPAVDDRAVSTVMSNALRIDDGGPGCLLGSARPSVDIYDTPRGIEVEGRKSQTWSRCPVPWAGS